MCQQKKKMVIFNFSGDKRAYSDIAHEMSILKNLNIPYIALNLSKPNPKELYEAITYSGLQPSHCILRGNELSVYNYYIIAGLLEDYYDIKLITPKKTYYNINDYNADDALYNHLKQYMPYSAILNTNTANIDYSKYQFFIGKSVFLDYLAIHEFSEKHDSIIRKYKDIQGDIHKGYFLLKEQVKLKGIHMGSFYEEEVYECVHFKESDTFLFSASEPDNDHMIDQEELTSYLSQILQPLDYNALWLKIGRLEDNGLIILNFNDVQAAPMRNLSNFYTIWKEFYQ